MRSAGAVILTQTCSGVPRKPNPSRQSCLFWIQVVSVPLYNKLVSNYVHSYLFLLCLHSCLAITCNSLVWNTSKMKRTETLEKKLAMDLTRRFEILAAYIWALLCTPWILSHFTADISFASRHGHAQPASGLSTKPSACAWSGWSSSTGPSYVPMTG
jgi:hypothetical protein